MISQDQLRNVIGAVAYDRDGDKIGKVGQVYYDDDTDQPKWVTVNTGFFGTSENFVPVQGAEFGGDRVTLAYDKAKVKDAPNVEADGELSPEEEARLYQHYGRDYQEFSGVDRTETEGRFDREDAPGTVGHDTSGPTTDNAMTRSEEELHVGTAAVPVGRARLRKHVVTEHVETTVPVRREEVRLEREPITDANVGDAMDGPAISDEEHEVVLHEEEVVVEKRAVPKERVRMDKQTVTEDQTVSEQLRKEQIEAEGDTPGGK